MSEPLPLADSVIFQIGKIFRIGKICRSVHKVTGKLNLAGKRVQDLRTLRKYRMFRRKNR